MITVFRGKDIYSLGTLKEVLRRQIQQLPRMISSIGKIRKIFRFEFDCEEVNLLGWLHNQSVPRRMYWAGRDESLEVAGIGVANEICGNGTFEYQDVVNEMGERLSHDNKNLRYYGGFGFAADAIDAQWDDFGSYYFAVPQFELLRTKDGCLFAFNVDVNDINEFGIDQILMQLEQVSFVDETKYRKVPRIIERHDNPTREEWGNIFNTAIGNEFEKIVLARQSRFKFDVQIRPSACIKFLKDQTPNCYHFCFQLDDHLAFLGATPERLLKINHARIQTEAVAGTTPKGDSIDQTKLMQEKLLSSEKFQLEHAFVVTHIEDYLESLCSHFDKDATPKLLELKYGQHLITQFNGHLKYDIHLDKVLTALHPTPAVAGFPLKGIAAEINKLEPFSRGWYAGPIGYVGHDHSEFAVGIRSGLVDSEGLTLFAGAGIVDGSTADDEWNEIENKISRFMKVFT